MHLKIKHFVIFITISIVFSCRERPLSLSEIRATQLEIEESIGTSDSMEAFISPYRKHVSNVLNAPLAYAPKSISKNDGRYNSSAGNLMADILMEQASPIFKNRTGNEIDFVVLNHGGIRSVISEGVVNSRTAYEVMPFENNIVVVEMRGKSIRELVSHLTQANKPHPISGIQIVLDKDEELVSVNIGGKPFDENRSYFVATSDYLLSGGNNMNFFKEGLNVTDIQYLVRNAMIDYFKEKDTLFAEVDDRFIRLD